MSLGQLSERNADLVKDSLKLADDKKAAEAKLRGAQKVAEAKVEDVKKAAEVKLRGAMTSMSTEVNTLREQYEASERLVNQVRNFD